VKNFTLYIYIIIIIIIIRPNLITYCFYCPDSSHAILRHTQTSMPNVYKLMLTDTKGTVIKRSMCYYAVKKPKNKY